MIEILHDLANQAGLNKVSVQIQATSNSTAAVSIQCIPHPLKDDATDAQKKLRDTLAMPIALTGIAGEVEAKLDNLLLDYLKTVKPHAASLDVQLNKIDDALKSSGKETDTPDNESSNDKIEDTDSETFTNPETDSL